MKRERAFVPSFAIAAIALLLIAVPASADHSWGNYHWERANNPITINHGNNVDQAKWGDRLTEALHYWGDYSSVLETPEVPGNTKPKSCRPTDGGVEVCSSSYGPTGWLGIAQIWASGDHIVKGTAKVNDYYHDNAPYDSYSWKQLVLCQEIGHTYGLTHQNEDFSTDLTRSCMEYTSDPSGNEHPDQHDYDQLDIIYAHLDGDGGGGGGGGGGGCWPPGKCKNGAVAPPAFNMPLPSIEQWGRLVETTPNGGQSVFVQDFGQGFRVITHVTWTLEEAAKRRTDAGHDH